MKKIAVILNGCGHRDGSEVHEAVLTLLGIEEAGGHWECLALDRDQAAVTDHVSGRDMDGAHRNMLHESARIAGVAEIAQGIRKLTRKMVEWA
jgi:enhancing lycopene biosynthesis protein 2